MLDIAGARATSRWHFEEGGRTGTVVHTDINEAMLRTGRDRLIDKGVVLPTLVCDAEKLPFRGRLFRSGERGVWFAQHDAQGPGLAEMQRVLKPGGRLMVLEFSKVAAPLEKAYDWYSFKILPKIWVSWWPATPPVTSTLAESIRMHPGQEELKAPDAQTDLGMWTITT